MKQTIHIRRFSYGAFVKLGAVASLASFLPFGLLSGIGSLFGLQTVRFNEAYLSGFAGLFGGLAFGLLLALFSIAFFATFGFFGIWLYAKFRPMEIEVYPEDSP